MPFAPLCDEICLTETNDPTDESNGSTSTLGFFFRKIIIESSEKILNRDTQEAEEPQTISDEEFCQIIHELRESGTVTNVGIREYIKQNSLLNKKESRALKEIPESTASKSLKKKNRYFFDKSQSFREVVAKSMAMSSKNPIYRRSSVDQMRALKRVSLVKLNLANTNMNAIDEKDEQNYVNDLNYIVATFDEPNAEEEYEKSSKQIRRRSSYVIAMKKIEVFGDDEQGSDKDELIEDFRRLSCRINSVVKLDKDVFSFDDDDCEKNAIISNATQLPVQKT